MMIEKPMDEVDVFIDDLRNTIRAWLEMGLMEEVWISRNPDRRSYRLTQEGIDYVERRMSE